MRARSSAIIGVVAVAVGLAVSAPFVNSPAGPALRGTEPAGLAPAGPVATGPAGPATGSAGLATGSGGLATDSAGLATGRAATGQVGTATAPAAEWIGLITGDQVAVDERGSVVAFRPGAGRGGIPLRLYSSGGHLYAVPADAAALVDRGVVDRRLFDVMLLSRPEYRRENAEGLAVIVTYSKPGAREVVRAGNGVRVEHVYTSIDGDGLRVGSVDAWRRLTSTVGIKRVWLDVVQDSL
ncbi:hypothetical protein [Kribbella koreensis]|uniref:hypothetical protein n=1 Tax=Kribbella koreensis TaxID=57909 RepID=UPI0031DB5271